MKDLNIESENKLELPLTGVKKLLEVMQALRHPQTGCPWDLEQSPESLAPYAVEEAYEVMEAIAQKDILAVQEELGDLLLQVVFQAQLATEKKQFDFDQVASGIAEKLIRRHPHVFKNAADLSELPANQVKTAQDVLENWEALKKKEGKKYLKDFVPDSLAPLLKALKIQKKAAQKGFKWPQLNELLKKIKEEEAEFWQAYQQDPKALETLQEFGDWFFAFVNLASFLKLDCEKALSLANSKFLKRFAWMESYFEHEASRQHKIWISEDQLPDDWQKAWQLAKESELPLKQD